MYKDKTILAVIPARGGSKGLPRKNLRSLLGKPLIAWTIEAALQSGVFDRVAVVTDDQEIAAVAKKYGAEVPFMEPDELAADAVKGINVILYAMDWFAKHDKKYDLLMCLQPTTPLRTAADIQGALALMEEKHAQAVVSVCKAEHSPLWANILPPDLSLQGFIREDVNIVRQSLEQFYRLNGAIYLAQWEYLLKNKTWYRENSYAYIMPAERSVDIDSELDLYVAEALLKRRLSL
ncbi:acylneuraminate cytidylyltransferase family protein [Candidatus Uhrbacteria bacterium]|nr:acylneuraminate cytidylyltransferase family protein [Candidatus Uhrbacteria bacterium]